MERSVIKSVAFGPGSGFYSVRSVFKFTWEWREMTLVSYGQSHDTSHPWCRYLSLHIAWAWSSPYQLSSRFTIAIVVVLDSIGSKTWQRKLRLIMMHIPNCQTVLESASEKAKPFSSSYETCTCKQTIVKHLNSKREQTSILSHLQWEEDYSPWLGR